MIGEVMDFLQTKSKPWSHSLFTYLLSYLFLFTMKEIRKEVGLRREVSRPLEGRRSEMQTNSVSPRRSELAIGMGEGGGRGGCTDSPGQGRTTFWEGRTGVI